MAVNVMIKQNKKELTVEKIASLKGLSYGVADNNFCLNANEIDEYTILYDANRIGRGIELSFENENIWLRLSLPTTKSEICLFYDLIKSICTELQVIEFYRDEELVLLTDNNIFIEADQEASVNAILELEDKLNNSNTDEFLIFGAINPIALGKKEMLKINGSLDGLENLLDGLQQLDVFYANPHLYKRKDDSIFGVYFVGEEIPTVLPLKPSLLFNFKVDVDTYYVMIPENNSIKYTDFINHVSKLADYDNSHIIVSLTEDVIKKLISKYNVDMITNNKKDGGIYYGTKFEHSNNHLNKIKTLNIQIDELAAYNHLAIYLRWCYEHELLTKEISSLIKEQKDDLRKLISSSVFNGGLYSSHFNELGKVFTKEFYSGKSIGYYPQCVDFYAKRFFGEEKYNSAEFKDEAYLFIPYDETYYQGLSKYIDKAWHDFMVKYKIS